MLQESRPAAAARGFFLFLLILLTGACGPQNEINPLHGADLADSMQRISAKYSMAGASVTVFCRDEMLGSLALGHSNLESQTPMAVDTRFRIASLSKMVTAIAVMQLSEQGRLDLDADLSSLLGFRLRNPSYPEVVLTPRLLLSHTSTLQENSLYGDFLSASTGPEPRPKIREALTAGGDYYLLSTFLEKRPGDWFDYTNLGYGLLGTLVEIVSGERFDRYVSRNVLGPLSIGGGFNPAELGAGPELAVIYRRSQGRWMPQVDDPADRQGSQGSLAGYVVGDNAMKFGPQGSLRISTVEMSRIVRMLMNGGSLDGVRILSQASVAEMLRTQWAYAGGNGDDYSGMFRGWGLGIHLVDNVKGKDYILPSSRSMFGHPGEAYGLVSSAYADPERGLGFVFATNGVGTGFSSDSRTAFYTVEADVFEAVDRHFGDAACSD